MIKLLARLGLTCVVFGSFLLFVSIAEIIVYAQVAQPWQTIPGAVAFGFYGVSIVLLLLAFLLIIWQEPSDVV